MKVTFTKSEMLGIRRRLAGFEPLRTDCTVEITDGIDVDENLLAGLRLWYLGLLDSGPREWVATENIASSARMAEAVEDGVAITVPDTCRRVFDIRLEGWTRTAEVLPASETDAVLNRQMNPFTAATAAHPVAVLCPGATAGRCGEILAWPAGKSISLLTAAVDHGEDVYSFDEAALGSLPTETV